MNDDMEGKKNKVKFSLPLIWKFEKNVSSPKEIKHKEYVDPNVVNLPPMSIEKKKEIILERGTESRSNKEISRQKEVILLDVNNNGEIFNLEALLRTSLIENKKKKAGFFEISGHSLNTSTTKSGNKGKKEKDGSSNFIIGLTFEKNEYFVDVKNQEHFSKNRIEKSTKEISINENIVSNEVKTSNNQKNVIEEDAIMKTRCTLEIGSDLDMRISGRGSFGLVFVTRIMETNEIVAIKKVTQNPQYKNRELKITQSLQGHPNVIKVYHYFFTAEEVDMFQNDLQRDNIPEKRSFFNSAISSFDNDFNNKENKNNSKDDGGLIKNNSSVFLNLVMEYMPSSIYKETQKYVNNKTFMPMIMVKLYTYQLLRSLNFLHSRSICHRDIKPQNLLVDPPKGILRLCDFGSAKRLRKDTENVSYICSRFYRAPELIFGEQHYRCSIDVWSAGCVLAEMLDGLPLFSGKTSVDQLVKIIKVMGTPSPDEILSMNPKCSEMSIPKVKKMKWTSVFKKRILSGDFDFTALDLLNRLLRYEPKKRIDPLDALTHPFFDDLRNPKATLPDTKDPLPFDQLFYFRKEELYRHKDPKKILSDLEPPWFIEYAYSLQSSPSESISSSRPSTPGTNSTSSSISQQTKQPLIQFNNQLNT